MLRLRVHDDGRGFDPRTVPDPEHFGMRGMRDLIREAGGTLRVDSVPGGGATVELEVGR
jgi:signal transduction histidine kinase